ncbi:MAG TPA: CoA ester lyase [Thermotogota bacterium]|nr:CoA ester lyase [Thermotogota bacterium]HPR97059.1 CoA ester lyase [Thermotogota bacterium]
MRPEKSWRTLLYVPGNNPSMIQRCDVYGADAITLDLEDSVGPARKRQARFLIKNALQRLDFTSDVMIRINSIRTGMWQEDLEMIDLTKIKAIRVPMVESEDDIRRLSDYLYLREKGSGLATGSISLLPGIETALGYINREKIIHSCERVAGVGFGSEDFITDTGVCRENLKFIKLELVLCAKAYGKCFIDNVYPDFSDLEAFREDCERARKFGADGKSIIHPSQIKTANEVFSPSSEEIERAGEILAEAERLNTGDAFNYKGQMVDKPIVDRCRQILKLGGTNG